VENVRLEVRIRWEVDRRKGDVTEQACGRALVKTEDAQLSNNVYSTSGSGTFKLGRFTLDLQPDFPVGLLRSKNYVEETHDLHNLQRIGEYLYRNQGHRIRFTAYLGPIERELTTWHPPAAPPAKSSQGRVIRPVSGSVALPRINSLTVSLIAFSGATPYNSSDIERSITLPKKLEVY
jgi:hypothetical protein